MKDLLNDALSEINDRHIEEAATYAPQTKTINWRKLLPVAACFVLVVVGAFTVKNYLPFDTTTTQTIDFTDPDATTNDFAGTPEYRTTAAGVMDSTTAANAPEISTTTQAPGITDESTTGAGVPPANVTTESTTSAGITEIRLFCTTPMKDYTGWENIPFDGFYHCINIGDDYYYAAYVSDPDAYTDEPLAKEKLGKLLYEFNRSDYRFEINGSSDFTVEVYEINGYSKEEAVAVGRKDGLMKGYYAYYRTANEE